MLVMMNAELKPFEDLAVSFAAKELAKNIEIYDRYPFGPFFDEVLDKAHDVGFFGMTLPEILGGVGQGISALCVILDNISRVDGSLAGIIFTNACAQEIILAAGGENTAVKHLSEAVRAKDFVMAYPSFCNPGRTVTLPRASSLDKGYTVSGTLEYLALGNVANKAVIPARVDGEDGYSFFLVDLDDRGVRKGEPIFTLGLHACPSVDVHFDGANARLIGDRSRGAEYFDAMSGKMHAASLAMAAGILKGCLKDSLAYARERVQGGRVIIKWSEVQMLLAGIATKADVADLCMAQVCQAIEGGSADCGRYAVSAAVQVHELACEAVNDGVQILGGNGYMKDYPQEKRYRDARQVQALLGTSPLKKIAIIKGLADLEDVAVLAA